MILKKVKIVSSEQLGYWYANRIGEEFYVTDSTQNKKQYCLMMNKYNVMDKENINNWIDSNSRIIKSDTKFLGEYDVTFELVEKLIPKPQVMKYKILYKPRDGHYKASTYYYKSLESSGFSYPIYLILESGKLFDE